MRDPALLRDRAFRFPNGPTSLAPTGSACFGRPTTCPAASVRGSSATRKPGHRRRGSPSTRTPGAALSRRQPRRCCWPRHRGLADATSRTATKLRRPDAASRAGTTAKRYGRSCATTRRDQVVGGPAEGHRPGRGLQQGFDGLLLIRGAHVLLSGVLSDYGWRVVGLVRCPPAEIESWPSSLRGGASAGGGACPAPVASESAGHGCSRSGSTGAGCDAECGGGARPGRGIVLLQRLGGGGPGAVRAAGASRGGG